MTAGELINFIRNTNPEEAKAQVDKLIKDRGISPQEFDQIKQKAIDLGRAIGIKV